MRCRHLTWLLFLMAQQRLGEALAIVLRYVTTDWKTKQALVRLQLLEQSLKHLKGEEFAREIVTLRARQYNVTNNSLLAGMREGAS